jgi:hypothetical protein
MNKYNYTLVYDYVKKIESLLLLRRLELVTYLEGIESEPLMFLKNVREVEKLCSQLRKIRISVKQAHREKDKLQEKKIRDLDIFEILYRAYDICTKITEELEKVIRKTNSVLSKLNEILKEENLSNIINIEVSNIGITLRELNEIERGYDEVFKELVELVYVER